MIAKEPRCREARTAIGKGTPASGRSPGRTSALDDFSNRIGESWSSLLALQGRSREPAQCRQANPSPSVRDAGVGFRIPFARRFARVTARPQTAIDPIKIPPRWKNIKSAPGGAHTFTKATSHGLRVRIWLKPANALPMLHPLRS